MVNPAMELSNSPPWHAAWETLCFFTLLPNVF